MMLFWEFLNRDARHYQILTLSILFLFQFFMSDFGSNFIVLATTGVSLCFFQYIGTKIIQLPFFDFKSSLITALSLTLLLKTNLLWLFPVAALLVVAVKFIIRVRGNHIFNPANIAIVTLLLLVPDLVWVSPGQWGSAVWFGFVLLFLAGLVLGKATRIDTALFFFVSYSCLLFGRTLWLGDPLEIPLHQLQSGALLIFTFFMITDPKTTPDHRLGRFLFVSCVAVLGFILQFSFQIREGLFYALAIVSIFRPLVDIVLVSDRFQWGTKEKKL
jgi:Na+-transporting NADH:ubiquinone oxidoreductase subunit NqrB